MSRKNGKKRRRSYSAKKARKFAGCMYAPSPKMERKPDGSWRVIS